MCLYPGGLKSEIKFGLESERTYVRVGQYLGVPLIGFLRIMFLKYFTILHDATV